jgi:ribosome maturation factor RimP
LSKITDKTREILEPLLPDLGLELWDVEFVREDGLHYLRVYIDKPEGVSLDDCEALSRLADPLIDGYDELFPEDGYFFEVSSAGAERKLRSPADYARFAGAYASVRLFKAKFGCKEHLGHIVSTENGGITIREKKSGEELSFLADEISAVRLRLE